MPRGDSTAAFLSALAAELSAVRDETGTVTAIVTRAVEAVADAEAASLTVRAGRRRPRYATSGWTDRRCAEADRLQYDLDEGPCLDAVRDAQWVRTGELGTDARWPAWGPRAAALGFGSVLSVRLTSRGEPLGALNLYASRRSGFVDSDQVGLATLFAVHAANALASARERTGLEIAMSSRHVIGMAQGILMERYGLDEKRAFAFLARLSSHQNRKLRDLAADLVATRTVPESDQEVLEGLAGDGGDVDGASAGD